MPEASPEDFRVLLRLLRHRTLAPLVEEAVLHYLDWDDLLHRQPLPGLTHAETWELLEDFRRFTAIVPPLGEAAADGVWYGLTVEGHHFLNHIRHHCRDDAPMCRTFEERRDCRTLLDTRVRETLASCRLDGLVFDEDSAGELLRTGGPPRSATERMITNVFEAFSELAPFASVEITPALLDELTRRLLRGIEPDELPCFLPDTCLQAPGHSEPEDGWDRLSSICDYANGVTGHLSEPTLCRAYLTFSTVTEWRPFPALNTTIGRILMLLIGIRGGYSGLTHLPLCDTFCRWRDGCLPPKAVRFECPGPPPSEGATRDRSRDMLCFLELSAWALDDLLVHVGREQEKEEALLRTLEPHERLNHRQHSVLVDAIRNPCKEFRVSEHQTTYHVVYQTARTDLLDLVERGYLTVRQLGRAFVFRAAEDLESRLNAR